MTCCAIDVCPYTVNNDLTDEQNKCVYDFINSNNEETTSIIRVLNRVYGCLLSLSIIMCQIIEFDCENCAKEIKFCLRRIDELLKELISLLTIIQNVPYMEDDINNLFELITRTININKKWSEVESISQIIEVYRPLYQEYIESRDIWSGKVNSDPRISHNTYKMLNYLIPLLVKINNASREELASDDDYLHASIETLLIENAQMKTKIEIMRDEMTQMKVAIASLTK